VLYLPYHKNKKQAFDAVQQGMVEVHKVHVNLTKNSSDYGHQLKHLRQEINEAYEQIQNALEVASETQRKHLEQYKRDLDRIVQEVNLDDI
jgi:predicted RNase H-like nuclease